MDTLSPEGLDAVSSIDSVEGSKDRRLHPAAAAERPHRTAGVLTTKPPGMTKAQWLLIQGVTGSLDRKPHVFVKR